jgi:methanogenic corrinoid protein MtbC1
MPSRRSVMRGSRESTPRSGEGVSGDDAPAYSYSDQYGETDVLEALMRTHVLPRVMQHHAAPVRAPRLKAKYFTTREITRFADSAVAGNTEALTGAISLARKMDVEFSDIWLGLLQPAARLLGDRWATDTCNFATVTLAMCQLHSLLRTYSPLFTAIPTGPLLDHRVLLTPAADEQHSFGVVMLAEFMRREGCEVTLGPFPGARGLLMEVRQRSFTVVGFSLSCEAKVGALARQISSVRRASKNPAVAILVGGDVFNEHPELVSRVGADWTARDAREAVTLMRRLEVGAEH